MGEKDGKTVIRAAKKSELEKIQELHKKGTFSSGLFSKGSNPNHKIFVATQGGKIVGFTEFGTKTARGIEGFVIRLEVAKGLKGKGIGHKLIGKAHSVFGRIGIIKIHVTASVMSTDFYKKTGYKEGYNFKTCSTMSRKTPRRRI